MNIILAPVITEKSESLKENNVYVFKVSPKANKTQIKNEIEKQFNVKVVNVNTVNAVQKKRRVGMAVYGALWNERIVSGVMSAAGRFL